MKLPEKTTYKNAAQIIEEKSPSPELLAESRDGFVIGEARSKRMITDLFIKAQAMLRKEYSDDEAVVGDSVRNAIEEYLSALERFEKGTLEAHASGKSIVDLL